MAGRYTPRSACGPAECADPEIRTLVERMLGMIGTAFRIKPIAGLLSDPGITAPGFLNLVLIESRLRLAPAVWESCIAPVTRDWREKSRSSFYARGWRSCHLALRTGGGGFPGSGPSEYHSCPATLA